MELDTPHLRLVLPSTEAVLARVAAMDAADRAEVSPAWLDRLRAAAAPEPWTHGFVITLKSTGAEVGSCGYHGPPDADGSVEIAYGLDAEHRGRGFATEAAQALTAFAFGHPDVAVVRAHTRPEPNASTRVLERCGFRWTGEVHDPEDGPLWRWERTRDAYAPPASASRPSNHVR